MPSLNLDLNYFDNIKTVRLRGRLGDGADVLPVKLWAHCGKHHPENGVLRGYKPEEIERICDWWGQKGQMVEAMVELNFLEKVSDGWKVHDWSDHEGHLAVFRERARNAAYARWGPPDASSIAQASPSIAPSNALAVHSSTVQSSTDHAMHNAREDEQRYVIPEPKEKPSEALIMLFKVLKGVPFENTEWDEKWRELYRPFADKLLRDCGSYAGAYACLEYYADLYRKKGYRDWTLRAIADRSLEWVGAQGGKPHGTANSERFFEALRKQRAVGKEDPGLRAASDAGALLGAIRDRAHPVASGNRTEKPSPTNGHG